MGLLATDVWFSRVGDWTLAYHATRASAFTGAETELAPEDFMAQFGHSRIHNLAWLGCIPSVAEYR
jgi:hypothetical protein